MFSFDERVIPLDVWITSFVDWLVEGYRWFFQMIKWPVDFILSGVSDGLLATPPLLVVVVFAIIAWRVSGFKLAGFTVASLVLIGLLGFWPETMITLAMVFSSVVFCTVVGVPFGIWAGRSDRVNNILRPVLDAMQTTPAFVYLVPIVMLFSIGNTAGVLATIIFALPPLVRLTSLGIRQVHPELVEAALAFGATSSQVLLKVQIPLALPTIMAGLNQTIMMSLSMVVIAAMIGAGGLGAPVVLGLNTLDIGLATVGGLAIVLLAIILDRITQSMATKKK
ncbi:MAG: proline/glycine betaine ABC transporter permease [Shewanella psychromarinicola]|mgnify:FL=1|jgi:glycine betaine/proline transport system permease protein|uniref:Proline/glycine betaine ABC transporter permease n=1 Tax=Shewanella psychromarinicola TaxID=2487742 RepID=A0A3N4EDW8_9GAMM|nr:MULTISPECIES: proline/glycine betaine ABC transporter permease [Shewanella]AZG34069.1 proline/glycine betaine ABC transporter permease [Shewanella psychromarinicola]MCL1081266.1 proline/glycine betaine ABC transporter permease [Shewanella psychromarinicola]PKG79078.1 glycine/betaine ABC transporter permease [Shewanella sp. Actino-trap-3]RPA32161.1 proline/glycine betaine ABC transporter permease [Shewanella psychromarinicola]|tara:strand:- start:44796 stop:45635 length:840 start_codon:yes stop_codon:yes gene_type:complete